MKKLLILCLSFIFFCSYAQVEVIFVDSFKTDTKYIDLSRLLFWGGNSEPKSVFQLTKKTDVNNLTINSINLINTAEGAGGYSSGTAYTSTCIDYIFDTINHNEDTIWIEFDYISEKLNGSGESGRLGIALMHQYPLESIAFDAVYDELTLHPFGRPAYNLRILNGTETNKQAYLFYGGGGDKDGEFERTRDNIWLPGFISAPGNNSPGSELDYPIGPVKICNKKVVYDNIWQHYTWKIMPETMEVYRRNTNTPKSDNQLLMTMQIPNKQKSTFEIIQELNQVHNTVITELPSNYNWFGYFNSIRFYFRSLENAYLSNIMVSKSSPQVTGIFNEFIFINSPVFYPNPTSNYIKIEYFDKKSTVEFFDVTGESCLSVIIKKGTNTLDISRLKIGCYFVRISNNNSSYITKIIIQ